MTDGRRQRRVPGRLARRRRGVTAPTLAMVAAAALVVVACGDGDPQAPEGPEEALFTVDVSGEIFHVQTSDTATIRKLEERMAAGVRGVINGELAAGDGGFNEPWSWHMVPGSVDVPDFAIEVCDGRPSFVEEDLDTWLNDIGRYCPWGALVVERER